MSTSFEQFKKQLDGALDLIKETDSIDSGKFDVGFPESIDALEDTPSLLARCESTCKKYQKKKPVIRIIHHLACSGGTLISKCISAMPNVYLLSEVHPYTDLGLGQGKPKYTPSDINSLSKYAGIPKQRDLAGKLFKSAIDEVYQHIDKQGGHLVLRDHTHADFNTLDMIPDKSPIIELLEKDYEIKSILTVRNPLDSYSSLNRNGWVHFEPKTFDEYCRRLFILINRFSSEQIFMYENFLKDSAVEMQKITKALDVSFNSSFHEILGIFSLTGDSGRSSDYIGDRIRIVPESIIRESEKSKNFNALQELLNM